VTTVFADQHLYKISEIMPDSIDLRLYDPADGLPGDLDQADALLVRTVTKVNKHTLNPVPKRLKFVGTGSAGTDHVDNRFLRSHNITFAHSAGCNADSVAEYVVTGLLIWAEQREVDLSKECIGIVGVGHVGRALKKKLDRLGWEYVLYDPPRELRDDSFNSASLPDLLECSILTFHTPLTREGNHPTYHWLDREKLAGREFKLVINTSRGEVIDEEAVLDAMDAGTVGDIIIDVWNDEPLFHDRTARRAFIATPHIAGYSKQSKFRATAMVVEALCDHFSLNPTGLSLQHEETPALSEDAFDPEELTPAGLLCRLHPINDYRQLLMKLVGFEEEQKRTGFYRARTCLPYRNEYPYLRIPEEYLDKYSVLNTLLSHNS